MILVVGAPCDVTVGDDGEPGFATEFGKESVAGGEPVE